MALVQKKEVGPTNIAKFSHIYFDFDHAIINILFRFQVSGVRGQMTEIRGQTAEVR